MIYFLIGIVGAFISALIANGKGRSPLGWGVAGFLVPVIAMIVVLVSAPVIKADDLQS
jgi:hypothetical protein